MHTHKLKKKKKLYKHIILTLRLCLGAWIKHRIGLILGLLIYLLFGKIYLGLDYRTKFEFRHKIIGLAIPIEAWV